MKLPKAVADVLPVAGVAALVIGVIALAIVSAPAFRSGNILAAVNAAHVVSRTNAERTDEGLRSLSRNAMLDAAAEMKAKDMAAKGYYAHVSPEGLTPMYWVERAGYKYLIIGENLVVNRTDADQVVDAFMGSSGHRANILRDDFTEIGVGVANGVYKGKDATFTVQIFAAPYPGTVASTPVASPSPVVKPKPPVQASLPKSQASTASVSQNVPRAAVAPLPLSVPRAASSTESNPDSLPRQVITLVQPLFAAVEPTPVVSSATGSTATFSAPSFSLNTSVPIELAGVSQLEADTLPASFGSTWTMEFRAFIESVILSGRGLFAR